jgi:large subunit ribosomal protein L18
MKNIHKTKRALKQARARRTRRALSVTDDRPRLSVRRSLKHISGQIITPSGKVLLAVSDRHVADLKKLKGGLAKAEATGALLAEKALAKKIGSVVFDKGPYTYHGRVKAFADAARKAGLSF